MVKKRGEAHQEPKLSAKERLAQRSATNAPKSTKAATVRTNHELTNPLKESVDRLAEFTQIRSDADAGRKVEEALVKPALREQALRDYLRVGQRTDNKIANGNHSSFIFVAADASSKFKIGSNTDGTAKSFVELLNDSGMPDEFVADVMRSGFVSEKDIQVIASPDHIEEKGNPELAEKMRNILLDNLSDEEITQISSNQKEVSFNDGFFNWVCKHVPGATEEAKVALFDQFLTAVKLVEWRITSVKCSNVRGALETIARRVSGEEQPKESESREFISDLKDFKAVVKGNKVLLYRLSTTGQSEQVGTKDCKDVPHALNTARKWMRNREDLERAVEDMER